MHEWILFVNYTLHFYSELYCKHNVLLALFLRAVYGWTFISYNNFVSLYNTDVVDYFPVNLELRFQGEPAQITLAEFAVTIRRDDVVEPVKEFYLNVLPIENAIILTHRITVRILDGKFCVLFILNPPQTKLSSDRYVSLLI